MKSAVKLIKSLHADTHTLSAMFIGYFVLLIVTATVILRSSNTTDEHAAMAHVQTTSASTNVTQN